MNHIDGNKVNNHFSNLEYVTMVQNCRHAKETGLLRPCVGSRHGMAKLKESDVSNMKQLLRVGNYSYSMLAKLFNVSISTVASISQGTNWKHVP